MDVMFLMETWHDSNSVSLSRLRADGFQVVDRPRPRQSADTMATNYGGVAAVAVQGVRLTHIDLGVTPGTFELLCVRVVSGSSSCVVAAAYRPGSVTVTECGDDVVGLLVRERRSLDILPVKKEAKLSASEVPVEVVGSGEEDLRCRRIDRN